MKGYIKRDWEMGHQMQMPMQQLPPQMPQQPVRPNVPFMQPVSYPNQNLFVQSRTLQLSGLSRAVQTDQIKSFVERFGPVYTINNQTGRGGPVIVTYFDLRDAIRAKNEMKNNKFYDATVYCDFIADLEKICDCVLMQPKFITKPVSIDSIKNELMSYGEIKACNKTNNGCYLVQFFDCRVPRTVIENGPFLINTIIFTPNFSDSDPNNEDHSQTGTIVNRSNILPREKIVELVKFIKSKSQK